MTRYDKYLWYVLRHKWFVFVSCVSMGWKHGSFLNLLWLGIIHDWSKFRPSEFFPYARHFFGSNRTINTGRNKTGYYKPTDTGDPAFDYAWFLHSKRNKHHWQYWCIPEHDGVVPVPMPLKYVREMVCDWLGASKAQGSKSTVLEWYEANYSKMVLHKFTQAKLETVLDQVFNHAKTNHRRG